MGKKDAQRTKGNTKSSSSARSAQVRNSEPGIVYGAIAINMDLKIVIL